MLVFCALGGVSMAGAADLVIDDRETADVAVSNDVVQASAIYFAADAAKYEKAGPGTWTVAASNVPSLYAKAKIAVREGALNLVGGATPEVAAPTAVLNRAAMWFDASKAESLVEGTNAVYSGIGLWYDVRETKVDETNWSSNYYCAQARTSWITNEVSDGVWEKVVKYPVAKTYEAMPEVAYLDFNGRQSGSWMGFLTPARAALSGNFTGIRHVFFAGYVTNAWGFVLGSAYSPVWHPGNTEGALYLLASANSASPILFHGRSLWNGALVDEALTSVTRGPYVYEWDAGSLTGRFANFFNDRNIFSPYFRAGGDSLGEVVVFTNKLTALEREQVSAYLLKKWRPAAAAASYDVRTAKGTSVTVGSGVQAELSGSGMLNLPDANRTHSYSQKEPFNGSTRVGVSAKLVSAEPLVALEAGDAYAVTRDNYDVLAFAKTADETQAAAGEAVLALGASTAVRVSELPETVKKVSVTGSGELILAAPRPATALTNDTGEVYATMPNADMEEWTAAGSSYGFSTDGATTFHWKLVSHTAGNYFLNMPACAANSGHWTVDGGNKKNFRWDDYVFQGRNVMVLKQGCVVENTVTFPADGDYEVTFLTAGRMDGSVNQYAGGWVKLSLVDGAGNENWFGTAFGYVGTSTQRQRFMVRGVKAGSYTFRLNHAVGSGDAHTVLDDFKFRRVTDIPSETVFRPPNADFECVDMVWAGRVARHTGNVATNWTLTSSTTSSTDPDACLVTRGIVNAGYRAGSTRGGVQLALYGTGASATSAAFTLPAGTWKLRLLRAAFKNSEDKSYYVDSKQPNRTSSVTAELLVGEAVQSLGTTTATDGARMRSETLPTAVTFTAPTTVQLRLREASAGTTSVLPCIMVDELEFVKQNADGELVVDGTFTNESKWSLKTNRDYSTTSTSNCTWHSLSHFWDPCRTYDGEYAYGVNYGVNKLALDICQCASADQPMTFPAAGTYRLEFSARSRLWRKTLAVAEPLRNWAGNQASFYLVDAAGTTNEIFRTPSLYSSNFVFRSALFTVSAAGTYTFGIRGLNGMTLPDGSSLKVGVNATDTELFIDQVSVKPVEKAELELDEKTMLELKDTAKLRLDFTGTNEIQSLKLGGHTAVGYVDATHASGLVEGPGCLFIRPRGTVMILR